MRLAWLALVAACGDHKAPTVPGVDAAAIDACVQAEPHDAFDDPTPCAPWGIADDNGNRLTQGGGQLSIFVGGPQAGYHGRCVATNLPFTPQGMMVRATGGIAHGGYAWFRIRHNASSIAIVSADGKISVNTATSDYDLSPPGAIQVLDSTYWWRIRQLDSVTLVGEVSANQSTWTQLGTAPGSSTEIDFDLGASNDQSSASGSITFDELNPCL